MTIIYAGTEDIDFSPVTGIGTWVQTSSSYYRSGYVRCCLNLRYANTIHVSKVFNGGGVTSCWLSCRYGGWSTQEVSTKPIGLGKAGTGKCIGFGTATASANKAVIFTYDGTTRTEWATETGASIVNALLQKFDLQIENYGASATVRLYIDNVLVIEETGDITISGVSDLDSVFLFQVGSGTRIYGISEIVVATSDTRKLSLVAHNPNAVGGTLEWTGAYTTVDEVTLSDADLAYVDADAKDAQYNMSATPAGTFIVRAIKVVARATKSDDSSIDTLKLGVRSDDVVDVDAGRVVATSWESYERYMEQIDSGEITTEIMDAVQVDLRSAT